MRVCIGRVWLLFLFTSLVASRKDEMICDNTIDLWFGLYQMKGKIRFAPGHDGVLNDPVVKSFFLPCLN